MSDVQDEYVSWSKIQEMKQPVRLNVQQFGSLVMDAQNYRHLGLPYADGQRALKTGRLSLYLWDGRKVTIKRVAR